MMTSPVVSPNLKLVALMRRQVQTVFKNKSRDEFVSVQLAVALVQAPLVVLAYMRGRRDHHAAAARRSR